MNKANIKPRKDDDGTSVEEEGVGVGGGKEYTEEELDLLQAKWVIGKQRGQEKPLKKEELAALLDEGRVRWEVVGLEEKEWLKKDNDVSKKIDSWKSHKNVISPELRLKKAEFIVKGLMMLTQRKLMEMSEKHEWESLEKKQKESLIELYFRKNYGVGWLTMIDLLAV